MRDHPSRKVDCASIEVVPGRVNRNLTKRSSSQRLRDFDYRQPADYFVTACTHRRQNLPGDITGGRIALSSRGRIAEATWKEIPVHFGRVRLGKFQIMPNHVHGIITILETLWGRSMPRPHRKAGNVDGPRVLPGSLSAIVRSYESAVTKACHEQGLLQHRTIWQSRFHDHIIRDDVSYFFIEQYNELNPLMWNFDPDNPLRRMQSIGDTTNTLKREFGLDDRAIHYLVEHESGYLAWHDNQESTLIATANQST